MCYMHDLCTFNMCSIGYIHICYRHFFGGTQIDNWTYAPLLNFCAVTTLCRSSSW